MVPDSLVWIFRMGWLWLTLFQCLIKPCAVYAILLLGHNFFPGTFKSLYSSPLSLFLP